MGGYVVQGRGEDKAARLLADARALEKAGCYSLILEAIPADLGAQITRSVGIPTIGIGAGVECDGQVLVVYDLLGMNPEFSPKFVKKYADLAQVIGDAAARYRDDVRAGAFPTPEHSFSSEKPAPQPKPAGAVLPRAATNGDDRPLKLYSVPARD
jgi:3-methyl-2-oxobutanoate hydroxymethyltransferase